MGTCPSTSHSARFAIEFRRYIFGIMRLAIKLKLLDKTKVKPAYFADALIKSTDGSQLYL